MLIAAGGVARIVHTIGTCPDDEMGLLGAAVSPNGSVYVYRTSSCVPGRVNQVLRGTISGDQLAFSNDPLVTGIPADSGFNNGGGLRTGPDGLLYVSTGDAGTPANAQSPSLAGKVLRVDPSAPSPAAEIFARGLRNPARLGFDPLTGRLWTGDRGQGSGEIDLLAANGNYGWPIARVPRRAPQALLGRCSAYPHSGVETLGSAVTGGAFAPANFGPYGGQYFFGDYVSGQHLPGSAERSARRFRGAAGAVRLGRRTGRVDIQFGADGGLYYVAINGGMVRRVGAGTGVGTLTDRTPPRQSIRIRKRQRLSRLNFADTLNEPATLTVTGTVVASGASKSKIFPLRKVVRQAQTNRRVRIRMKLRKSGAVSAARLVRRGKRTRVRIKVTARDAAGNVSTARRTVRITRR